MENINEKDMRVIIDVYNTDDWCIHNSSGQLIEDNFISYSEAETWAFDNGYEVVKLFN
jgi:hypothetical protein